MSELCSPLRENVNSFCPLPFLDEMLSNNNGENVLSCTFDYAFITDHSYLKSKWPFGAVSVFPWVGYTFLSKGEDNIIRARHALGKEQRKTADFLVL